MLHGNYDLSGPYPCLYMTYVEICSGSESSSIFACCNVRRDKAKRAFLERGGVIVIASDGGNDGVLRGVVRCFVFVHPVLTSASSNYMWVFSIFQEPDASVWLAIDAPTRAPKSISFK